MYRVEWLDSSLNELAAIWMAADTTTRSAIRRAASTLEERLCRDPHLQGESREGDERVVFFEPLGASVEIDMPRRIVTVLHLWRVRRR